MNDASAAIVFVRIGGVQHTFSSEDQFRDDVHRKINNAVKILFQNGYRRFRISMLPKDSDYNKYKIMAWPA
jgi:DNA-directed RNA polymerase alpha subunit